jgi:UDP-N-acetylmuramoyl-tripeptide--D-alanyl-D-alanine ligase
VYNEEIMIDLLKNKLYFPLAWYFRIFAEIRLRLWHPKVIVVTGSNGKTTLLHLIEAVLGESVKYSHHANSSFGIPFDILDLHRHTLRTSEWISLFLQAPLAVFKQLPKEKIYVVEADCDRPGEGKFLASLLRPSIVLWVSSGRTHSMNFDKLVRHDDLFSTVEEAIAYEYGYFLEYCLEHAAIDGSNPLVVQQISRTKIPVEQITKDRLDQYEIDKKGSVFIIDKKVYEFSYLLPEEAFISICLALFTAQQIKKDKSPSFSQFSLPPGRSSVFAGIKDTTLIDSTYNANLGSMQAILSMFAKFPAEKKWIIVSDMMELGKEEKEEHEGLAEAIATVKPAKVILLGKRTAMFTYPKLFSLRAERSNLVKPRKDIVSFLKTKDANTFIAENLSGGESLLFKGSQAMLLEGLIAPLLKHKEDIDKLPRRGTFWDEKRRKAGL